MDLVRFILGKIASFPLYRQLTAFNVATNDPQKVQEALLERIITFHKDTDYGRDHDFANIRTVADYRKRVRVAPYEAIEPYIERVRQGQTNALLADDKVFMFALTSGTTAARKYIPVTRQYLADYRRGWNLWGLQVFQDHREVKMRPIVQFSGDWEETRTDSGVPCGAVTGLTANMQKRVVRWIYCVPACVGKIEDIAAKYYTVLRLSIPYRVGMIIAANPSTLVNMAKAGDRDKEQLIRDLFDGTLSSNLDIAPEIRRALRFRLHRHRRRARVLEEIVRRTGRLYPRDYWPRDNLLGNWTGGSVGAYLRHYPHYFGAAPVRDIGLIASEGRMTIPFQDRTPGGVLDITSHFFEFIPEHEIDRPDPQALLAHEVEEGKTYFIVPTTASGLYRYHISDLVRVSGFHHKTPMVEFLSKGAHFSNVTGEKLSEHHVTQAMTGALAEINHAVTAYSLAPCWNGDLPYYGLFVEEADFATPEDSSRLAQVLDRRLTELNIEYESKRTSLRLGAVQAELLPRGAWQAWDRRHLEKTGGPAEQYKHPCLIPDPELRQSFQL
jgi:hypothetical protein